MLVYLGRSSRLKQVWATGRYSSPPPVGWITSLRLFMPRMGMRSLPVRNTADRNGTNPSTGQCSGGGDRSFDHTYRETVSSSPGGDHGTPPRRALWSDDRPSTRLYIQFPAENAANICSILSSTADSHEYQTLEHISYKIRKDTDN